MKINLPVTEIERDYSQAEVLISETDPKGVIKLANASFCEVAGFKEVELSKKSHNVVRHPDMPPEAFADLWQTIKSGSHWIGYVKNRCANGDYYWVKATVTPVYDGQTLLGYRSVRKRPAKSDVAAAENLYQRVKGGEKGLIDTLRDRRKKAGLLGRIPINMRFWALAVLFLLGLAGVTTLAVVGAKPAILVAIAASIGVLSTAMAAWFALGGGREFAQVEEGVDGFLRGDLASRVACFGNHELGHLATRMNQATDMVDSVLGDVAQVLTAMSRGDFSRRIVVTTHGDFLQLKQSTNSALDNIASTFEDFQRILGAMADGDLTQRINEEYHGSFGELATAVNATVDRLAETISQVTTAADGLSNAASQVSSTAQSLSQAASEQAASVEETSASMEQMSASISQNTENARVTDDMASKSAEQAKEGGEAVVATVEAMRQIAGKIKIIDDIAYKTNLLAFNAAIEAARAGEHGKGFAVVAAEVRNLAERSSTAAQEIGGLAASSVERAERAGRLLDAMVPSIVKTSNLVQEIAAASSEQATGVSQVNTAINQVSQATQSAASGSEQLAATSEQMAAQADELRELMAFFSVDDTPAYAQVRGRLGAPGTGSQQRLAAPSGGFDFDNVIVAHQSWKTKLRNAIREPQDAAALNTEEIRRDDACALGKWIHGSGTAYKADREYHQLLDRHADFHRCAADVVHHCQEGDLADARAVLNDRFLPLSDQVVGLIRSMKKIHATQDPGDDY
jgi:methyl-accepting chemotaxis protein